MISQIDLVIHDSLIVGGHMSYQSIRRPPAVQKRLGLSRSTRYLLIQKGELVRPIKIGPRAIGWTETDIDEYISKKIKDRDQNRGVELY